MDFQKLAAFLDRLPQIGAPGVDCIVKQGYETVFRHQAGYADREAEKKMDGTESFFLYSSTKPITCTAALQLYEAGAFLLDDPVSAYIPEFADMQVRDIGLDGTPQIRPARTVMTIRDLFTMTSGLDYDLTSAAIQNVQQQTQGHTPTVSVAKALARQSLAFDPGTHWLYSLSHDVLGALVEVVSGQRFGDYLRSHIFEPLHMENTGFVMTSYMQQHMMAQYHYEGAPGVVTRMELKNEYILGSEYESGGAGLISTVDDYSKFTAAMANGGKCKDGTRILSPATIHMMRTNHLTSAQMTELPWDHIQGFGYGLGVRTMVDPIHVGSNGNAGAFGWCGAAGSFSLMDPSTGISLFYAQQMRDSDEKNIYFRLQNILYSCLG